MQELHDSRDCTHAGISQLPLYAVQTSGELRKPSWSSIPGDFRPLSGKELARMGRRGAVAVWHWLVARLTSVAQRLHVWQVGGPTQRAGLAPH